MRAFMYFTKKEFYEYFRTYKLFILVILFLCLGFLNPITANYMPALMKEFMPQGINITLAQPTVLDSWMQFFKNVPQIGLIAFIIVLNGMMTNELSKGTLINMLTKGLSRKTVIFSKFTAASVLWTFQYFLAFFVTLGYNLLFWKHITMPHLIFSVVCVWIFGLLLISCLILGGILFKSAYGGLLFVGLTFIFSYGLSFIKGLSKFNPIQLVSQNVSLLTKEVPVSDVTGAVGFTIILTSIILTISIIVFNKTQV